MSHSLVVLVENKLATLERVVGLLRRRMYSIEGLSIATTEDPTVARLTIQVTGDITDVELVKRNLQRLYDVWYTEEVTHATVVARDLALVKLRASRAALLAAQRHAARVVYTGETTVVVEMAGLPDEVDDFLAAVQPLGVVEVARSGHVTLTCADAPLLPAAEPSEVYLVLA